MSRYFLALRTCTFIGIALGLAAGIADGQTLPATASVNAPSWVKSIAPGTWAKISLNTLSDVDPEQDPAANPNYPHAAPWHGTTGQASVIQSWNGGAFASRFGTYGSLILFGGGHANYYGSEVYAFDMGSRTWKRLTNPYPGPYNWPYTYAEYPDGSAVPPHTYSFSAYDPKSNSYVLLKGQNALGNVTGFSPQVDIVHMFSLDTMTWRRSRMAPDPRPKLYSGGWSVYDTRRGYFWGEGGSSSAYMAAFDPSTDNGDGTYGTWLGTYTRKTGSTDAVADYDPTDDIIVILPWRDYNEVVAADLANPNRAAVTLNVTGTAPAQMEGAGFSWSNSNNAFIEYGGNDDSVYQLSLSSGNWDTGTWRWDKLTASSNTVVPESPLNHVFDRFQVVQYADAQVAVVVNSVTGPVYAFRIPTIVRPKRIQDLQAK